MDVREKILKEAFKLFIEIGFWEVSVNQIIEKICITKSDFCNYFNSKDQLICEAIDKFFFQRVKGVASNIDEFVESSKVRLLEIFRKYSEIESYLKYNIRVDKINYKSIICLMIEGEKNYESMTNYIIDFNKNLLEEIEFIIEYGKSSEEILWTVNSKPTAYHILESLQSNIVLWAMNQNINIKMLFQISFKYLWNSIKSSKNNCEI